MAIVSEAKPRTDEERQIQQHLAQRRQGAEESKINSCFSPFFAAFSVPHQWLMETERGRLGAKMTLVMSFKNLTQNSRCQVIKYLYRLADERQVRVSCPNALCPMKEWIAPWQENTMFFNF
ncbi:MAG TPA: hypothetical protein DCS42_07295 [Nitrospiraceae bacterium]|nr:MAG: hypothetical protein A2072_07930 [Nitrospirae bacterium GWC1_57_7]HAS53937.1 hypothetical protein [Nitrospiraceae bacterium]